MLPAQRNKIDIKSLTEEEQKLFRLYGKLPNRKDVMGNKLQERKYFDSGDYALSKAGRAPQQSVGTAIPNPESIPHASTLSSPPNCTAAPTNFSVSPTSVPVPVPGSNALSRNSPQVSTFPTATGTGTAGSPAKEPSALARQEIGADDLMDDS